jgi:hypothetical protein
MRQHGNSQRGRFVRLGLAAIAACCVAWPAAALAGPRTLHQVGVAEANSQTFTDPAGDSVNAPDVTTTTASNDDSGKITLAVSLPNRPSLSDADFVSLDVDTDGDLTDGFLGADYQVAITNTGATLYHATSSNGTILISPISVPSFNASFGDGVETISVNKADVGDPAQIGIQLATSGDNVDTLPEFAPDSGWWSYQIVIAPAGPTGPTGATGPPPVKLAETKPLVRGAVAGRTVTVTAVVTNNGTGVAGTLTCSAKVAGKALAGARRTVGAAGKASCSWRLPRSAHKKSLTGKIGETYQGKSISRPFSARIR